MSNRDLGPDPNGDSHQRRYFVCLSVCLCVSLCVLLLYQIVCHIQPPSAGSTTGIKTAITLEFMFCSLFAAFRCSYDPSCGFGPIDSMVVSHYLLYVATALSAGVTRRYVGITAVQKNQGDEVAKRSRGDKITRTTSAWRQPMQRRILMVSHDVPLRANQR